MVGIKEWIRSRSKSRSRDTNKLLPSGRPDSVSASQAPPLPPQASDGVLQRDSPRSVSGPHGALTNTSAVNKNRVSSVPVAYENSQSGPAPDRGGLPYHGSTSATYQATTAPKHSKSPGRRSFSFGSRSNRRFSSGPAEEHSNARGSTPPPGTALSTDEPELAPRTPSRRSTSSQRQPVASLINNMYSYSNYSPLPQQTSAAQGSPASNVSVVPGQYRHPSSPSATASPNAHPAHRRAASGSSKTPIAEQFSASTFYNHTTPPDSGSSPSHTLRHQPDVEDLSSKASTNLPPRGSSLAARDQNIRGRIPRRSLDKPLPVPKELAQASWDKGDPAPISTPLQSAGRERKDDPVDNLADRVAPLSIKRNVADDRNGQLSRPHNAQNSIQPSAPSNAVSGRDNFSPNSTSGLSQSTSTRALDSAGEKGQLQANGPRLSQEHTVPEAEYTLKPLTPFATPMLDSPDSVDPFRFVQSEVKPGPAAPYTTKKDMLVQDASKAPDLRGIVNLTNTEDTTVETIHRPAVTHETILPSVHHIRHEEITREYHTYDIHHRILPIIDVQVLPAKHFVPNPSGPGYIEVPAEQLPGRTIDRYTNRHWVIAETVSKPSASAVDANGHPQPIKHEPRRFTARTFADGEGDYKEWIGEDGVPRTETTWVHPPHVSDELRKRGLTQPLLLD